MAQKKKNTPRKPKASTTRSAPRKTRTRRGAGKATDRTSTDPFADREQLRYAKPIASREHLLTVIGDLGAPATRDELQRILRVRGEEATEALRRRLNAMVRDGQLVENRRGAYLVVDERDLLRGRITAHPNGFGFMGPEDGSDDLYLSPREMRAVLHGDRVVARVSGVDRRGRREGQVVEVLERANESIVGRLVIERGAAYLRPENARIHQDIMVGSDDMGGARNGQIVLVEIVRQPDTRRPPLGRVVQVLGDSMAPGMEIDIAILGHGIPNTWPDGAREQAEACGDRVRATDKRGRLDLRDVPLVTIDGEDARDFDDAVWCERRRNGSFRLLVAIADVAHYVTPGSPLDLSAEKRGTSVYFPGRVVPMLPEALSNGLCSLNPDVDRLCMVAELSVSAEGALTRTRFHEAVMRSHARLTYTEVAAMLIDRDAGLRDTHAALVPHLENLHALFQCLIASRQNRGAIEFESTETRIEFDASRKIDSIVPVVRNDAHRLIEECMILANVAAAKLLQRKRIPTLYRVHEGPNEDKLTELREYLSVRGLHLGGGDEPSAQDYAQVVADMAGRSDAAQIQTVLLRSLKQAVYQPANTGHFGLALDGYAHFTSPIRRYPDLLVHRAIKHVLGGGTARTFPVSLERMNALGESSSLAERRADDATRDVVNWLKCEYMRGHVGERFSGAVSAVTSFGLFVELSDVHVEGLVHITSLPNDYYHFEPAQHTLIGKRGGRRFALGDPLAVRVVRVDLDERKIDLELVEPRAGTRRRGKKRA
ncbi:MAG: ribonuclease R [Pseudomonadota bacterium]